LRSADLFDADNNSRFVLRVEGVRSSGESSTAVAV
jgi:hypothetical protein